jgi:hypothetical protein
VTWQMLGMRAESLIAMGRGGGVGWGGGGEDVWIATALQQLPDIRCGVPVAHGTVCVARAVKQETVEVAAAGCDF